MKGGCGMLWEKSTPFDSEIEGQRYMVSNIKLILFGVSKMLKWLDKENSMCAALLEILRKKMNIFPLTVSKTEEWW